MKSNDTSCFCYTEFDEQSPWGNVSFRIAVHLSLVLSISIVGAALYLGASASEVEMPNVRAAAIISQAHQLSVSVDGFQTEMGRYPDSIDELNDSKHLAAQVFGYGTEHEAATWSMPVPGAPLLILNAEVPHAVCLALNKQGTLGLVGIPLLAYPGGAIQCFGTEASRLTVLIAKPGYLKATPGKVMSEPPQPYRAGDWYTAP